MSHDLGSTRLVLMRQPVGNVTLDYAVRLSSDGLLVRLQPDGPERVAVARDALLDHLESVYPLVPRVDLEAAFDAYAEVTP